MTAYELHPHTDAGQKFVALAEQHATEIAARAAEHDRDGTFPVEAIEAMKASGFVTGAVPQEFGGLGVSSVRDVMVGVNRLARADGSIAIAINMHFSVCTIASRLLRAARERGDETETGSLTQFLSLLGSGMIAMANGTEAGTDLRYPMTEATRVDDGWRVDGRKIFGTLSPVADLMLVTCRARQGDGSYVMGNAIVFRGTPGQTILDNWDALGMRASGSNDVVYENCVVPNEFFFGEQEWGELGEPLILIGTAGNLGLLGAFVGIAEAARAYVVPMLQKRTKQPTGRPLAERRGIQHGMAELDLSLSTCRSQLAWIADHVDELIVKRPVSSVSLDELHELMAAAQASKIVLQRSAIDVVDKAMQLSGGAGYFTSNPFGAPVSRRTCRSVHAAVVRQ